MSLDPQDSPFLSVPETTDDEARLDVAGLASAFRTIVSKKLPTMSFLLKIDDNILASIVDTPALLARWAAGLVRVPKVIEDSGMTPEDMEDLRDVIETALALEFAEEWKWVDTLPRKIRKVFNKHLRSLVEHGLRYWWRSTKNAKRLIGNANVNPYPMVSACLHEEGLDPKQMLDICDSIARTAGNFDPLSQERVVAAAICAMSLDERNGVWQHIIAKKDKIGQTTAGGYLRRVAHLLNPQDSASMIKTLLNGEKWRTAFPWTTYGPNSDTRRVPRNEGSWPLDLHLVENNARGTIICTPAWMTFAKQSATKHLKQRVHSPDLPVPQIASQVIANATINGQPLDQKQIDALQNAFKMPLSVIQGAPGTGKTTICQVLRNAAAACNMNVVGYAPTGRAAKRLELASGIPSRTIHSGLLAGGRARKNSMPVCDIAVIDEASMLDTRTLQGVALGAADTATRLVLIGDPDQLPPVEGNRMFGGWIKGLLPWNAVTVLDTVHRHDERTLNAHAVHNKNALWKWGGTMLKQTCSPFEMDGKNFTKLPDDLERILLDWVRTRRGSWQIMTFRRDVATLINQVVRKAVNNGEGAEFIPGDRAMQTHNDYDEDLRNGEQCDVLGVANDAKTRIKQVTAKFEDGRVVVLPASYTKRNWRFAWASTVHSAQGGQWDDVLVVIPTQDAGIPGFNQEWLYTAITRVAGGTVTIVSDDPDGVVQVARQREPRKESAFEAYVAAALGLPARIKKAPMTARRKVVIAGLPKP